MRGVLLSVILLLLVVLVVPNANPQTIPECTLTTCTVDAVTVFDGGGTVDYSFYGHDGELTWQWWDLNGGAPSSAIPQSQISGPSFPDVSMKRNLAIAVWDNPYIDNTLICDPDPDIIGDEVTVSQYISNISYSIFNGTQWSNSMILAGSPGPDNLYTNPSVAVDRDGKAIALWLHKRLVRNNGCVVLHEVSTRFAVWDGSWSSDSNITPFGTWPYYEYELAPPPPAFDYLAPVYTQVPPFTDITFVTKAASSPSQLPGKRWLATSDPLSRIFSDIY